MIIRTIQRALDSLKAKGIIERVGSNKTGYWKIKILDSVREEK